MSSTDVITSDILSLRQFGCRANQNPVAVASGLCRRQQQRAVSHSCGHISSFRISNSNNNYAMYTNSIICRFLSFTSFTFALIIQSGTERSQHLFHGAQHFMATMHLWYVEECVSRLHVSFRIGRVVGDCTFLGEITSTMYVYVYTHRFEDNCTYSYLDAPVPYICT